MRCTTEEGRSPPPPLQVRRPGRLHDVCGTAAALACATWVGCARACTVLLCRMSMSIPFEPCQTVQTART